MNPGSPAASPLVQQLEQDHATPRAERRNELAATRLYRQMVAHGNWLFRWRSYLPITMIGIAICAAVDHPEAETGFAWEMVCLGVSVAGLLIRCHVVAHAPRTRPAETRWSRSRPS